MVRRFYEDWHRPILFLSGVGWTLFFLIIVAIFTDNPNQWQTMP